MERRSRGTSGQTKKMTRTPNTVSGWQPATASCLGVGSPETEGREPGDGKAKLQHKASHYAAHSPCSGLRYYFRFTRGSAAKRLHPGLRLYRPTGSKLRALRAPEQIDYNLAAYCQLAVLQEFESSPNETLGHMLLPAEKGEFIDVDRLLIIC